tara:strand:+ start:612 stop:1262 length:651 start_codon:yes stop_codon:yes gene_type:complete
MKNLNFLALLGSFLMHTCFVGGFLISTRGSSSLELSKEPPTPLIEVSWIEEAPLTIKQQDTSQDFRQNREGEIAKQAPKKKIVANTRKTTSQSQKPKVSGKTEKRIEISDHKKLGQGVSHSHTVCEGEKDLPLYAPRPQYPKLARRKKWEGKGLFSVEVNPEGKVVQTAIVESTHHKCLDDQAVDVLKKWRFSKGNKNCQKRYYSIPITYSLQGNL